MFHNLSLPENCQALWQTCHDLVPELLQGCTPSATDVLIKSSQPIDPASGSVYLVKEGTVNEICDNQLAIIYEKGDLIGLDGVFQEKACRYENDFAIRVDEYNGQQLLEEIASDKNKIPLLSKYLSCLSQSFTHMFCHYSQQDMSFSPDYRFYQEGDVIIEEDTEGDEVFTLLSGSAKVVFEGTEVGKIKEDEIFGAIAAITNTKRTASIIATSNCETIVVKSESFRGLLSARPETVEKLVKDMARMIVSSNERVIELTKNKD